MLIPTKIIDTINNYLKVDVDLINISEKQSQKLIKVLIELWYFIYNSQIEDKEVINLQFYKNINHKYLRKFDIMLNGLRLKHKDLIKILEMCNLIEVNNKFSTGKFSKGYKIIIDFIDGDYTEVNLDFKKIFNNTRDKSFWLKTYQSKSNLIEDAYKSRVDLSKYLNWLIDNEGIKLNPVLVDGVLKERFLTKERIWFHFNLALKVNMKNLWFKVSDQGRFYNSFSNLPHTAVPFLLIDNQKTWDFDVSNCQPLLLSLLIDNKEYKKDVVNGVFYDKVSAHLGMSRANFKVLSFKYIFFGSKPLKSGGIYDGIKYIYGSLIDDINDLKEDMILSHKLQEIESDIFVNKLGKIRINKLLRHDQIIVKETDKEIIKKYINIEFKKLGIDINTD